jgi:hypothetical protein
MRGICQSQYGPFPLDPEVGLTGEQGWRGAVLGLVYGSLGESESVIARDEDLVQKVNIHSRVC